MKKEFSAGYILSKVNRGCYEYELVEKHLAGRTTVTIDDVLNSTMPFKDIIWFLMKKCELSEGQKQAIDINLVDSIIPMIIDNYPNNEPLKILDTIKIFLNKKITEENFDIIMVQLTTTIRKSIPIIEKSTLYCSYLALMSLYNISKVSIVYEGNPSYDAYDAAEQYKGDIDYTKVLKDKLIQIIDVLK